VLDGVRGLAIGLVLLFHCFDPLPRSFTTRVLGSFVESMFIGVDLFFVLSGFLITGILIRTRGSPHFFRYFYARRVLRILPPYYAVLAFVFLAYTFFGEASRANMKADGWWLAFYLQNWVMALEMRSLAWEGFNHLWSLAIEEQFYLVWPLALWLTPTRLLARLCAGAFLMSCGLKLALVTAGVGWLAVYTPTVVHVEGLAAGAWIAAQWHVHGRRIVPRAVTIAGLAATAGLGLTVFAGHSGFKLFSPPQTVAHAILSSIVFSWLLYAAIASQPQTILRRALGTRPLTFLGRYSYEIYLTHWMIACQIRPWLKSAVLVGLGPNAAIFGSGVIIVALSIVASMALYQWIDLPLLALKRHFPHEGARRTEGKPAAAPNAVRSINP
jgi:peptidoglycan/LPS O-acetylase OafA/YrhL